MFERWVLRELIRPRRSAAPICQVIITLGSEARLINLTRSLIEERVVAAASTLQRSRRVDRIRELTSQPDT
jgi:hypothetical protein